MQQGCVPLTTRDVLEWTPDVVEGLRDATRQRLRESRGREPSAAEVAEVLGGHLAQVSKSKSEASLPRAALAGAVVVSAEEVADYWHRLPSGTDMVDIVSCVVPPYDRLFVEFQRRPNKLGLDSWGVLFLADQRDDGWDVEALLIGERRKGHPVGPLMRWLMPLDRQGLLPPGDAEGHGSLFAHTPALPDMPETVAFEWANNLADFPDPLHDLAAALPECFAAHDRSPGEAVSKGRTSARRPAC
jgi:hypothetical protein